MRIADNLQLATIQLTNFVGSTVIGTAVNTVDKASSIEINQTTSALELTLPNPTNIEKGLMVYIHNIGSASFHMYDCEVLPGTTQGFIWRGTAWTSITNSNNIGWKDVRATNKLPQEYGGGVYWEFKQTASVGLTGVGVSQYGGLMTYRRYAKGNDMSGGPVRQEIEIDNGKKYYRLSTSATTRGPWIDTNNDNWRSVIGDLQPDGTSDITEGIYHNGAIHYGNAQSNDTQRFMHEGIVSYVGNGNFKTQVIQTNMAANSIFMPTIYIKGYVYGIGETLDLQIPMYLYNSPLNTISSAARTSKGSYGPTQVRAGFIGGLLALEITRPQAEYYNRYEISCYCDGASDAPFEGWTVTNATFATAANIVTVNRKSDTTIRTVGSGTTTVLTNDYTIAVNNGAIAATIQLPNPSVSNIGKIYIVKRNNNTSTAAVNIRTVSGASLIENYNGANTTVLLLDTYAATGGRYGVSAMLQSDGTKYHLIR